MAFQIRAGVSQQREAGGVRFGKSVQRERGDGVHDGVLRLARDAVARPCPRAASLRFRAMRFSERLKPMARRNSSASPPVNPAAIMAMRSNCS